MTALPDIPRLYTALAECLAVLLVTPALMPRFSKAVTVGVTLLWAAGLSAFLGLTGNVPGGLWIPCMVTAIGFSYLYLWGVWSITLLEAGYHCARAFILAELAASVEWQLHCALWPARGPWEPLSLLLLALVYGALFGIMCYLQHRRPRPARGPWEPLSLLLLALVYGALFGIMCYLQHRRPRPAGHLQIGGSAALTAVMLALTAFAVSNLGFLPGSDINMSIFSIRTLVDFSGVLILTVQHEQLRENALHGELAAMDEVLHRQYEQYKRSKEGINLINRRYHELKIQLARIREEQDQTKQNAAIAAMEQNIRQYEAENKTGNPVLDTLLTAKTMECQQENITITSVADGRMLGFLTIRELCTIVGVALDNAIAAVRAEPDPEKRLIKVAVYSQGGFAMLRFEHYTEAAPALDADGLPKQGSDLKSVRTTAQQHGGSMTMHWENNWCTLRILFPLPQNE